MGWRWRSVSRHGFLLALHGTEEESLQRHEALADQALGAAGALEALRLGVPVVLTVGNPLGFGVHRILAGGAFLEGKEVDGDTEMPFRSNLMNYLLMKV